MGNLIIIVVDNLHWDGIEYHKLFHTDRIDNFPFSKQYNSQYYFYIPYQVHAPQIWNLLEN